MRCTVDPRLSPDFQPEFFPSCDGCPAPPPDAEHPVEARMLEFAAAYYRLNRCYERLRLARTGASTEKPEPILEEIDQAVHARDALEDRLSPEGFYAEPIMEGILAVNLLFSYATKRPVEPVPPGGSSFSMFVPMPLPGADLEEHLRQYLGSVFGISPAPAPALPAEKTAGKIGRTSKKLDPPAKKPQAPTAGNESPPQSKRAGSGISKTSLPQAKKSAPRS